MPKIKISPRLLRETGRRRPGLKAGDPSIRKLRIFAIDPGSASSRSGVVEVRVDYEDILRDKENSPGSGLRSRQLHILSPYEAFVAGETSEVSSYSDWLAEDSSPEKEQTENEKHYRLWQAEFDNIDLDGRQVLVSNGYPASLAEPKFIAQMVYAVVSSVSASFERALGRQVIVGLECEDPEKVGVMTLNPWAAEQKQAWYDRRTNTLNFGFFRSVKDSPGYSPGSILYSALSHDVIVHEFCHAILDSVSPHFIDPVHVDVLAFHEAYADLIAIFQRFGYVEVVKEEISRTEGKLSGFELLNSLATSFAQSAGYGETLRTVSGSELYSHATDEPHARGEVLVQAVYRAFVTVADRRIADVISIATGGTGQMPPGMLPEPLVAELSRQVRKTAMMFQTMMIRALDYCPPNAITFFDFLRAVIAADVRIVPDDESNIRTAWMEAFRFHQIFSTDSLHYSDESLAKGILVEPSSERRIGALSYEQTRFNGNPGDPLTLDRALEQANEVALALGSGDWLEEVFGKTKINTGDGAEEQVKIISLRSFARPGPNGMTEFGTVIEILREASSAEKKQSPLAADGATLVFDSNGCLAAKAVSSINPERIRTAESYASSAVGRKFWEKDKEGEWSRRGDLYQRMCIR